MLRLFLLLFASSAFAEPVRIRNGDITASRFTCNRSYLAPEIPCRDWRGRVAVNFDLDLFERGFWRNQVHSEGTPSKFETVGWKYELGLRLPGGLEFGLAHHSQHRMDEKVPPLYAPDGTFVARDKFPVEDSVFLRIQFAGRK